MAHSSLQSPSLSLHDTKGRLSLSKHLIKASEEHQVPFLYRCKTQHGEVVHSSRWVVYSKAIPDWPTVSVFSLSNCSWWYSLRIKKILLSDLFELGWYQNQTLEPTVKESSGYSTYFTGMIWVHRKGHCTVILWAAVSRHLYALIRPLYTDENPGWN